MPKGGVGSPSRGDLSLADIQTLVFRRQPFFQRVFAGGAMLSLAEARSLAAGVQVDIIQGGPAGAHTVTGIAPGDALRKVLALGHRHTVPADASGTTEVAEIAAGILRVGAGGEVSEDEALPVHQDLTGEFTISAADTIDNAGGTDTTDRLLLVVWEDLTP